MKKLIDLKKVRMPRLKLIRRDPFGNYFFFKRALIGILGMATYTRFNILNKLKIEGTDHLRDLPDTNVMFVSNHQTYYADVMALYHVFCSVKWRFRDTTRYPLYFLMPRVRSYYVAAEETMKDSGWLPKILSYTGAVTVKRSWRAKGKEVDRGVDKQAPDKIQKALAAGWVVNFPQGTTKPYAPVRKGTANLIKTLKPIVVPVVIDGFRRAFDKKGLMLKKRGTTLSIRFKQPIFFDDSYSIDDIHRIITQLIEQEPERKPGYDPLQKDENARHDEQGMEDQHKD